MWQSSTLNERNIAMEVGKVRILLFILLLFTVLTACDTVDPTATVETELSDYSVMLAPAGADQKVYAIPATKEYHLALCPHLTAEKQVMLISEAIEQGYKPCEHCFPPPEEPKVPHVYVLDGSNEYHLANCVLLDATKQAIPETEAIEQGYTPCRRCNYDAPPVASHVYVMPGDEHYHINYCQHLTDEKELVLKAEAIEEGYTPCPDCAVVKRLTDGLNKVVWVTETGDDVYHIYTDCQSLYASAIPTTKGKAIAEGRRLCEHCEERLKEEEQ